MAKSRKLIASGFFVPFYASVLFPPTFFFHFSLSGQVYFVTLYFEKEYITTNEAVIGHEDEGKDGGGGLACCDGDECLRGGQG